MFYYLIAFVIFLSIMMLYVFNVSKDENPDENLHVDLVNYNYDNNNNIRYTKYNELYKLCHRKSNYICDNGICKKNYGDTCLASADCSSDSVCYHGICVKKPGKWETPVSNKCGLGLQLVNNHLTLLNIKRNKFELLPEWIEFGNSIDICYNMNGNLILMTKDKIYDINPVQKYKTVIREIKRPFKNNRMKDRMFNYNGKIYYLNGTTLYIIIKTNKTIKYQKYKGTELDNIILEDGTILSRRNKKYYIDNIMLKGMIRNFLTRKLFNDRITNIGTTNIGTNIYQIIRSPNNKDILYCLNNDNTVDKYDCFEEKITRIDGYGKKLIVADNKIWLLTINKCI